MVTIDESDLSQD